MFLTIAHAKQINHMRINILQHIRTTLSTMHNFHFSKLILQWILFLLFAVENAIKGMIIERIAVHLYSQILFISIREVINKRCCTKLWIGAKYHISICFFFSLTLTHSTKTEKRKGATTNYYFFYFTSLLHSPKKKVFMKNDV